MVYLSEVETTANDNLKNKTYRQYCLLLLNEKVTKSSSSSKPTKKMVHSFVDCWNVAQVENTGRTRFTLHTFFA